MEIFINGNAVNVTLENERTLGDVLKAVEQSCAEQNATIVGVEIDGNALDAAGIDSKADMPITQISVLKLATVSSGDIASSFSELLHVFLHLEKELPNIPLLFQSGRREDSYRTIQNLADAIDSFCRLTTLASLFPKRFSFMKIDGKAPSVFFNEFAPILNDFCKALEDNDIVMMGDLAEYEICPRISVIIAFVKDPL